jgi:Protein of unknown function (DUF3303)
MLYMIIEHFRNRDAVPVYRRFRDQGRLVAKGYATLAAGVTKDFECCFQIMEFDDHEPLTQWMARWDDLVRFEVFPVTSSAEAAAAIAARLRGNLQRRASRDRLPAMRVFLVSIPARHAVRRSQTPHPCGRFFPRLVSCSRKLHEFEGHKDDPTHRPVLPGLPAFVFGPGARDGLEASCGESSARRGADKNHPVTDEASQKTIRDLTRIL